MKQELKSELLEELTLMEDTPLPVYCGEFDAPCFGPLSFSVHLSSWGEESDEGILAKVEQAVSRLLLREPCAKLLISAKAIETQANYWGGSPIPSSRDFAEQLKLSSFNCFPDGTFELWYPVDEPVTACDLTAQLDAGMGVISMNFDG